MLPAAKTAAQVFIPYFDATRLGDYFQLASVVRASGVGVEVYPRIDETWVSSCNMPTRKGFRIAVIAGEREFAAGECQVKNLATAESTTVSLADNAVELVREIDRILATCTT